MTTYLYTFAFTTDRRERVCYAFPAHSKQMAWVAAASYVACHTLMPAVTEIALVGKKRIVEVAIEDNEVSQIDAACYLEDPRVRD
jgi:hypothetical protein